MIATLLLLTSLSAPVDTPDDATVAKWVADLSENGPARQTAVDALMSAGPKAKSAVPALIKLIDTKGRNSEAVEILGAIGPGAKDAVPVLMGLLPKEPGGFGFFDDAVALALARIDGPKIEATRVLMFGTAKGHSIYLTVSGMFKHYPAEVTRHLVTLCSDKDAKTRAKAAEVIGTLKEKEITKVPQPTLYEKAGDATKGIPAALEKLLTDESPVARLAAARAITHVAPEHADKAIAVTITLAQKTAFIEKGEIDGYGIFQSVPEKAAKALLPLLDEERERVRMWAVNNLVSLREPARVPVEGVLKDSKSARARQAAATTLGHLYGNGAASIPVLTTALADSEFEVRFASAIALVHVGSRDNDAYAAAVPVLIEALQQKDERVRLEASQYLSMTGPAAKTAVPALTKLLGDPSAEVKLEAGLSLVAIDKVHGPAAVPALIQGLKLSDSLAARAAKALGDLGPVAKDALPDLLTKFDAKNVHLRLYSAEAAARIDPTHAPKAVAVIAELLKEKKHQRSMIRSYGFVAFRNMGPAAKSAMPSLEEFLKDDGPFHFNAAAAMLAIDPDSKPAFEWIRAVMADKLKDDNEDIYSVLERLPELGVKAAPLVPDLVALLKARTPFHRIQACETLGAIGPAAKAALPDLKKLAESDPRKDVREDAAAAIKKIEAK